MSDLEDRMESMLFNYQTTNRNDYRGGEITPPTITAYEEKPTCLRVRPPPLKDVHTLSAWKEKAVPFSLMHRPRPIVGTDPTKVQEIYIKPSDLGKENAIKTRPRLVITPAVSMDDISNPRAREILCASMYTSDMTRATKEAVANFKYFTVKAPLPGLPAPANPITLPKLQLPYVAPEWRMETVTWDQKQLRSYCHPTKEFWLRHKLTPCRACKETEIVRANRHLQCELKYGKR